MNTDGLAPQDSSRPMYICSGKAFSRIQYAPLDQQGIQMIWNRWRGCHHLLHYAHFSSEKYLTLIMIRNAPKLFFIIFVFALHCPLIPTLTTLCSKELLWLFFFAQMLWASLPSKKFHCNSNKNLTKNCYINIHIQLESVFPDYEYFKMYINTLIWLETKKMTWWYCNIYRSVYRDLQQYAHAPDLLS